MSIEHHRPNPEVAEAHRALETGRDQINAIDDRLAELVAARFKTLEAIIIACRVAGLSQFDAARQNATVPQFEQEVAAHTGGIAKPGYGPEFIRPLLAAETRIAIPAHDIAAYRPHAHEAPEVAQSGNAHLAEIDAELAQLISQRLMTALAIGAAKQTLGLSVFNAARERDVEDRFLAQTTEAGVPRELSTQLIAHLVYSCREIQTQPGVDDLDAELIKLTQVEAAAR